MADAKETIAALEALLAAAEAAGLAAGPHAATVERARDAVETVRFIFNDGED